MKLKHREIQHYIGHYFIWIDEFRCLNDSMKQNATNDLKINKNIVNDEEVRSNYELNKKKDRLIEYASSILTTEYSMLRYFKSELFGNTVANDDTNEVSVCPKCCRTLKKNTHDVKIKKSKASTNYCYVYKLRMQS